MLIDAKEKNESLPGDYTQRFFLHEEYSAFDLPHHG
jgi:hypothetical protein